MPRQRAGVMSSHDTWKWSPLVSKRFTMSPKSENGEVRSRQ
jgi:hypothetical protein